MEINVYLLMSTQQVRTGGDGAQGHQTHTRPNRGVNMLNGWKGIAAYINRDERTAIRWAVERGMPVHRTPGRGRGSVYALRDEIDAWLSVARKRTGDARTFGNAIVETTVQTPARRLLVQSWHGWLLVVLIAICVATLAGEALVPRGGAASNVSSSERAPTDPGAKASYLQATYDWNLRTRDSLRRAIREYGDAIAHDPRAAASYVGLANSYLLLPEDGGLSEAAGYLRAEAAARTALMLAPNSAGAHRALAFVAFWWRQNRELARREFARALALAPDDPLTHHWFATALSANGEQAAALREINQARDLDPTETAVLADAGMILYRAGHREEGAALLRELEVERPNAVGPHWTLAMIALLEGRPGEYVAQATTTARLRGDRAAADALSQLRPAAGDTRTLIGALLGQARNAAGPRGGWYRLAQLASLAGRHGEAAHALARSCSMREAAAIGASGDLWLLQSLDKAQIVNSCGTGQIG